MAASLSRLGAVSFGAWLLLVSAGDGLAQPVQSWAITTRQSDALAETRIGSLLVRLSGRCAPGGPQVVVNLEGYRGGALRKVDQVEQPAVFIAEGPDGSRTEHRGALFLFGDEVSMPAPLPAAFVARLGEADRLLIRNATGQPIVTVALADARDFPTRLARVCGTAVPGTTRAEAAAGSAAEAKGARVIKALPLKRGFYVASDTLCGEASNATLQLLRAGGIGVARETCAFKRIEQTAPSLYRVTEECRSIGGGRPQTQVSLFDIRDDGRFSVSRSGAKPYHARYCAQSSLPSPWRDNDIRDLIR